MMFARKMMYPFGGQASRYSYLARTGVGTFGPKVSRRRVLSRIVGRVVDSGERMHGLRGVSESRGLLDCRDDELLSLIYLYSTYYRRLTIMHAGFRTESAARTSFASPCPLPSEF